LKTLCYEPAVKILCHIHSFSVFIQFNKKTPTGRSPVGVISSQNSKSGYRVNPITIWRNLLNPPSPRQEEAPAARNKNKMNRENRYKAWSTIDAARRSVTGEPGDPPTHLGKTRRQIGAPYQFVGRRRKTKSFSNGVRSLAAKKGCESLANEEQLNNRPQQCRRRISIP
jgi:hypothetical protein